jgi:[ribosomal protein S5]-alanine N-acetyltransferase
VVAGVRATHPNNHLFWAGGGGLAPPLQAEKKILGGPQALHTARLRQSYIVIIRPAGRKRTYIKKESTTICNCTSEETMLDLTDAFAAFPVLETERFLLRAVMSDDIADIFRIMSDPRVKRYFGSLPMTSPDEAEQRVQRIQTAFQEHSGIRWAIADRAKGQLIGTAGFWRVIKPHFRAEIGYELAPEWWGQGVMTEALGALLGFAFTRMGLHSIEAQIHPDNSASRRVLEKLGFVQEGFLRENFYDPIEARFTDTVVFGLLNVEWMRRTANDKMTK